MGDDGQNGQTLSNISIIPLDFWNRESVFPKRSCNESIGCLYTVGYFSPRVFYEPTSLGKKGFSTTANIPEDLGVFLDLMELESTGRGSNRCIIYTYIYIYDLLLSVIPSPGNQNQKSHFGSSGFRHQV